MDSPSSSGLGDKVGSNVLTQATLKSPEEHVNSTTQPSPSSKSTWRHIFAFTERQHTAALVLATVAAACAAGVKTSNAIFLGKFLDIDTQLGEGTMTTETAAAKVASLCIILTAIGVAALVSNWAFMTAWIIFGELTAKSARKTVFTSLLYKEMAWFDSQLDGMSSALSSVQV